MAAGSARMENEQETSSGDGRLLFMVSCNAQCPAESKVEVRKAK
jgi:hypothetical protein